MNHRTKVSTVPLIIVFSFALTGSLFSASAGTATLKALIVTGQSNHNWRLSTPIVKQILEQTNLFKVDIAISPGQGGDGYRMEDFKPNFAAYDVVVLNYVGEPWSEQTKKAFVEYVRSGGGVVAFHSACNAFPSLTEYLRRFAKRISRRKLTSLR